MDRKYRGAVLKQNFRSKLKICFWKMWLWESRKLDELELFLSNRSSASLIV